MLGAGDDIECKIKDWLKVNLLTDVFYSTAWNVHSRKTTSGNRRRKQPGSW